MKLVYILRTENTQDGVFGRLKVNDRELFTMEEDWKNNEPHQSCIPAGRYRLKRVRRPADKGGYETFEICDVPGGRTYCRFHPANTEEDVEGCIGVGLTRGMKPVAQDEDTGATNVNKRAVLSSKEAFRQFMAQMDDDDEAELLIEWAIGLP